MALSIFFPLIFAPMIAEAIVSARHDRALRALGAVEPDGDVYKVMVLAYPGCFLVLLAEGALRGVGGGTVGGAMGGAVGTSVSWDGLTQAGLAIFAVAKALKYWAMASLGVRWTFRVLVPPGSTSLSTGPYRWVSHPNYLAVVGELTGTAIAMHALVSGLPVTAAFGFLMWRRVGVEENALAQG